MMTDTSRQFEQAINRCKDVFVNKMKDYGSSWRSRRAPSLTDQIYIKANRIRSIEHKGVQKVDEGIRPEFIGIVNYSVIALIQLELEGSDLMDIDAAEALKLYDKHIRFARDLMENKNHDYEDKEGETLVSEGVDANYRDIINYALFALIKLEGNNNP